MLGSLMTISLRADGSARVDRPDGDPVVLGRDAVDVLMSLRGGRALPVATRKATIRRFTDLGLVGAELALVPGETRGARRALPPALFRWLRERRALRRGCLSLDVGCGMGRVALELARAGARVTAIDASPRVVAGLAEVARAERLAVEVACARATDLPQLDDSMDLVVLDQVLPFVRPLAALEEAMRVTRPGGTIVVVINAVRIRGALVSPATAVDPALVFRAFGWRRIATLRTHERVAAARESRTTTAIAAVKPRAGG